MVVFGEVLTDAVIAQKSVTSQQSGCFIHILFLQICLYQVIWVNNQVMCHDNCRRTAKILLTHADCSSWAWLC